MSLPPVGHVVIVGAGQAGFSMAIELRKLQFPGRISLLGQEPYAPYQRPPLSKSFLLGAGSPESLLLMPPQRLQEAKIDFVAGARVLAIDRSNSRVHLADGDAIHYDRLALATGGVNRHLPIPGAQGSNVVSLRTVDDAMRLRAHLAQGRRLVIVGGGFIGLEVAAMAVKAGLSVVVLEAQPRVLSRVTAPEVSAFFESAHRKAGADIRTNAQVAALIGEPVVREVMLADGSTLPADLVLVGIGTRPDTRLAEDAGLDVQDGILVDAFARTSDPNIVAAGDCTQQLNALTQRRVRLESIQNANDQARTAAATLSGQARPNDAVPWFWSDQGELKFQAAGLSVGHDHTVLRGNPDHCAFSLFYFRANRLVAVDSVNRPTDHLLARRWIAQGVSLDPQKLADESISLGTVLS
jgi:3-phenylpropionate/trans-cinnamate dioxygenase ferredoxin reductase component